MKYLLDFVPWFFRGYLYQSLIFWKEIWQWKKLKVSKIWQLWNDIITHSSFWIHQMSSHHYKKDKVFVFCINISQLENFENKLALHLTYEPLDPFQHLLSKMYMILVIVWMRSVHIKAHPRDLIENKEQEKTYSTPDVGETEHSFLPIPFIFSPSPLPDTIPGITRQKNWKVWCRINNQAVMFTNLEYTPLVW